MKKILSAVATGALLLSLTACSSEEPLQSASSDGTVNFHLSLPAISTRAFGDEVNLNQLSYAIYDTDGNLITKQENISAFGQGVTSASVTVQLVPGVEYNALFYASNSANQAYTLTLDGDNKGVFSVDYTKVNPCSEVYDAFYSYKNFTVSEEAVDVTLQRPFAQLNIGTNDSESAAVTAAGGVGTYQAELTISSGVLSQMSLISPANESQQVAADEFSYTINPLATYDEFPLVGEQKVAQTIAMNYLLVAPSETNDLIEGSFAITRSETPVNTIPLSACPIRANYRTNIYGSMLTTGKVINITVDPAFTGTNEYNPSAAPAGYTEAKTADELYNLMKAGTPAYVAEGTTLDLSSWKTTFASDLENTDNAYYQPIFVFDKPQDIIIDGALTGINEALTFSNNFKLTSTNGKGSITCSGFEKAGSCIDVSVPDLSNIYGPYTGKWIENVEISGITINALNCPGQLVTFCATGVQNVKLTNSNFYTQSDGAQAVQFNGARNAIITACNFQSKDAAGLQTAPDCGVTAENCTFIGYDEALSSEALMYFCGQAGYKNFTNCFFMSTESSPASDSNLVRGNTGTVTLSNFHNAQMSYLTPDTQSIINISGCYIQNCAQKDDNSLYIGRPNKPNYGTCKVTITDTYFNKGYFYLAGAEPKDLSYEEGTFTKSFLGSSYTFTKLISSWTSVVTATN